MKQPEVHLKKFLNNQGFINDCRPHHLIERVEAHKTFIKRIFLRFDITTVCIDIRLFLNETRSGSLSKGVSGCRWINKHVFIGCSI